MRPFTTRDRVAIGLIASSGALVTCLALIGRLEWALAALGLVVAAIGCLIWAHHARQREELRRVAKSVRIVIRDVNRQRDGLQSTLTATVEGVDGVRGQIAALRLATEGLASIGNRTTAAQPAVRDNTRPDGARRSVGIVGFFGHGNYGDELFLDVFKQYLGADFDLSIIPDLESRPYFSRPVEEKVADVDAIVMGGGDLIQRWNMDPRYFDLNYLKKPLYVAGVGVPVYQNSDKHEEKPHIIARLQRFFGNANVRMIGMRDDFGANWIRTKLSPTAPVLSEPDIVCSLDLPPVEKPKGLPILGIVTRQRRVTTPDDYSRLEELAEHAKRRGFRIRHIILGTGSVGERDLANAPALRVSDKELVHSENLEDLTRAIGECTVLASMKFHGTVVATMYGVPSIVLVPTNKNRNFMARIGRDDLVASHNSDKLLEIFGMNGPEPIAPADVEMLRTRSTAFMEDLRGRLLSETGRTGTV